MDDYKFLFKVVLIGNAGVGKTCLVRRFTQGLFPPGQGATIGVDFMIKTVEINGEKIKLQVDLSRNPQDQEVLRIHFKWRSLIVHEVKDSRVRAKLKSGQMSFFRWSIQLMDLIDMAFNACMQCLLFS